MRAVIQTSRDADIKLARKIGEFPIADNASCKFIANVGSVKEFIRCQSGNGTSDYTANVVKTGLERTQSDLVKPIPDVLDILDCETSELNLLTRRKIRESRPVFFADFGNGAKLLGVAKTAGHAETHHKCSGSLLSIKDAYPLEPVTFVRWNSFPTVPNIVRDVIDYLQPIFFALEELCGI